MRRHPSCQPHSAPAGRARLENTSSTAPTTPLFTALPDVPSATIASFLCLKDQLHVACCSRRLLHLHRTQTQALTLRRRYFNPDNEESDDDDDEDDEEEDEEKKEKEEKPVTLEETMETWTKRAALARLLQGACGLRYLRVPDGRDMELVFDAMRMQCLTRLQSLSISRDEQWVESVDDESPIVCTFVWMDEDDEQMLTCAMRGGALPSLQTLELAITGDGLHHMFNALSAGACPLLSSLSLSAHTVGSWEVGSMGNADSAAVMQARAEGGKCSALKSLFLYGYREGRGVVGLQQALMSPLCSSLEKLGVLGGVWERSSSEVAAVASWLSSGGARQLQSLELVCYEFSDDNDNGGPPDVDAVIEAIVSSDVAAPKDITHLTIHGCKLSAAERSTLTEAVESARCLTSLTSLDLSCRRGLCHKSPLDHEDGEAAPLIAAVLRHCTQLCDLVVDTKTPLVRREGGVVGALAHGLLDNSCVGRGLRKLNLLDTYSTGAEADLLATVLRDHDAVLHSLTELKISRCELMSTELIRVLAQRTVLPALQTLDLSHKEMGDSQVKLLFSGAYPSLTTLALADVGLTSAGVQAIGEILCRDDPSDPSFPQLRDLDLTGVDDTESVLYIESIARALSGQGPIAGTLVKLVLSTDHLSPISARLLARALCNPGAAKLEYLHCDWGLDGFKEFIDVLLNYAIISGRGLSLRHLHLDTWSSGKLLLDVIARLKQGGHMCGELLLLQSRKEHDSMWLSGEFKKALKVIRSGSCGCKAQKAS